MRTKVSSSDFLKVFGDHNFVVGFSETAKIAILEHIENDDLYNEDSYWSDYFIGASEWTTQELINRYDDTLAGMAKELIALTANIDWRDEVVLILDNDDNLSDNELWRKLNAELLTDPDYLQLVAQKLADIHHFKPLSNKKWLTFTQ